MKIKKNIKKAGVGLLVSAVAIGGAFAWLSNTDIATKHNDIKVGSLQVIFDNQENVVTLAGNDAIPMTEEYAILNTTPYSFTIDNTGSINANYTIKAVADDGNTISNDLILISLDSKKFNNLAFAGRGESLDETTAQAKADEINDAHPEAEATVVDNGNNTYYVSYLSYREKVWAASTREEANNKIAELTAANPDKEYQIVQDSLSTYSVFEVHYGYQPISGTWHKLSDITLLANEGIIIGNSHSYKMYVRIAEDAVNNDILAKTSSFHLEVESVQNNEANDTHVYYYIDSSNGNIITKETYDRIPAVAQAKHKPYVGSVYKYTMVSTGQEYYRATDGLVFYRYELGPNTDNIEGAITAPEEYNIGDTYTPNPTWIVISKTEVLGVESIKVQ